MKLSFSFFLAGVVLTSTSTMAQVQDACPAFMDNGSRRLAPFLRHLSTTAIIDSGVIRLGINNEGSLNVGDVGLQFNTASPRSRSTQLDI